MGIIKQESNKNYWIIGLVLIIGIVVYLVLQMDFTSLNFDWINNYYNSLGQYKMLIMSILAFMFSFIFIAPLFKNIIPKESEEL